MRRLGSALGLAGFTIAVVPWAWPLPVSHTIERVPFVEQQPGGCGPAALESILRHYGVNTTQRAIADEIALPNGEVLNLDLKLYARRKGLRAESARGDLDQLKTWIARDVPVICQVRAGGLGSRRNHFIVVFGYDERKLSFIAHTGERAAQEIPFLDFARSWRDADNWMLVIRPPRHRLGSPQAKSAPPAPSKDANAEGDAGTPNPAQSGK
jgi:ABC-type bacteriocin/lantibiotic exporter with double-glycine peptidase domain